MLIALKTRKSFNNLLDFHHLFSDLVNPFILLQIMIPAFEVFPKVGKTTPRATSLLSSC